MDRILSYTAAVVKVLQSLHLCTPDSGLVLCCKSEQLECKANVLSLKESKNVIAELELDEGSWGLSETSLF